jgi:polar amino acid transport system ATP-binding protein
LGPGWRRNLKYLSIEKCDANYGKLKVLSGVSLDVDKGDVVSLIGPSGSGKSTLLRVLVGLNKPVAGRILLEGEEIDYQNKRSLKKARDRFAIVFQQYNLFQNMTVLKNVTIAPVKIQGRKKNEVTAEAEELLKKVGLGEKLKSYPDELSGGQQQRVAIARSLALKPEILLLDEVTSALDPELINEVLDTIRVLAREDRTMIIVSHEMSFVREVSNKIAFMDAGQIIEIGDPQTILENPSSQRARDFMSSILRH